MIPDDQVDYAVQFTPDSAPGVCRPVAKIAKMKDNPVRRHGFIPDADELGVHILNALKRMFAIFQDLCGEEMRVRREPHLLRVKIVNSIVSF